MDSGSSSVAVDTLDKYQIKLINLLILLFVAALLNHQMEQCMKLERELNMARHEVQEVKSDVIELEKKLNINQLLSQGKISVSFQ